ncbi:MAG TPA: serine protease [Verrucomicrobiae bacterium]|nr:serine protease [Verrucomicrobiae bacterium]
MQIDNAVRPLPLRALQNWLIEKRAGLNVSRRATHLKLLLLVLILIPCLSHGQTLKPEEIYQRILPTVMTLHVQNARGENYIGTAFLALDKNVAVTAWHVVSDAAKVTAKFSDGRVVNVQQLIDKDEEHDIALIRLDGANRPEATLSVADPAVGSRAYVIGAPKGFDFSITDGLVSQLQTIHGSEQYQVSCPISGGNSGGPVVNERGEVLGVAAWTQKDAQNLSFAIPASFLTHLNPHHTPTPWSAVAAASGKISLLSAQSVNTSEPQRDIADLKHFLNNSAGERVTITVTKGDGEKKFDVVLPKNFAR